MSSEAEILIKAHQLNLDAARPHPARAVAYLPRTQRSEAPGSEPLRGHPPGPRRAPKRETARSREKSKTKAHHAGDPGLLRRPQGPGGGARAAEMGREKWKREARCKVPAVRQQVLGKGDLAQLLKWRAKLLREPGPRRGARSLALALSLSLSLSLFSVVGPSLILAFFLKALELRAGKRRRSERRGRRLCSAAAPRNQTRSHLGRQRRRPRRIRALWCAAPPPPGPVSVFWSLSL